MLKGGGAHQRRRERYANADALNTNVETGANHTVFYGFDNRGDRNGFEIAPGSAAGGTTEPLLLSGGGVHQRNKELDVGTDMPHVHDKLGANTKVLCAFDDHGAGNGFEAIPDNATRASHGPLMVAPAIEVWSVLRALTPG